MAYKTISIEPIAGSCGAEVSGVNIAKPINRKTFTEIYEAWLAYQVLFFRDQKLTSDQYLKFAKKWGGIHVHPFVKGLRRYPEILEVKKTETDTYTFGNRWHTDQMFAPRPAKATLLYAKETPTVGGDTLYANMYDAYEALSPGMKKMLEPIRTFNVGDGNKRSAKYGNRENRYKGASAKPKTPPKGVKTNSQHPLVRTHPETGRKALYIGVHTQELVGFSGEEGNFLIDMLRAHCTKEEFIARFNWQKNSIAIWDNRCLQHYAVSDYPGQRRRMHRITIKGDKPR